MKTTLVKNEFCHLEYELVQEKPFLHLQIYKWSKELYNEYLKEWCEVKKWFKEHGYNNLWVAIPADDPKLRKFEEMFGFKIVYEQAGYFLLTQEI